ncbi:MAG: TadE/TadG family type IV pilus assembly protein [Caulobacterales bacterium]
MNPAPANTKRRIRRGFFASREGAAAVEFAIVAPMLVILMLGIVAFGGYFFTAHTVQQLANDAARAAIAGLDDEERLSLAQDAVETAAADQPSMRGAPNVSMTRDGAMITLRVTYDASGDFFSTFAGIAPSAPSQINATATIRTGGLW